MTGILDETLEGLGEMFEGYSAETCAIKIPLVPQWAERRVPHARRRERGPPSALAEILGVVAVVLGTVAQNPIRVYRRILNFCMGS